MLKLADNLDLPIDFVTERIAFLARTGAGKSGGMRVLFEQMFDAGMFSVFIDPKGDAWGIRAAGEREGKPVLVIGGDHADIPLEPTAGKYIAEFLVRERVSTVIDMSDLSTQQMWTFFADFGSRMYKLNRDVCHIFIDEADMIAGQQFFDPHCLHAIQLIQNKGRGRGFGMTIATQRPQILNKTVLNASGTLIAMQTIGDDALKVVKSWLGQTGSKETILKILGELPLMQNREAFVYSPQTLGIDPVRIRFAGFQTFDSMRTPRPGEARRQPKSVADIDLSAITRDMATTIEEARANDPKTLKAQIKDLEKQITELRKSGNSTVVEVEVEKQVAVFPLEAISDMDDISIKAWEIEQALTEQLSEVKDLRNAVLEFGNKYKKYPVSSPSPVTTPWPSNDGRKKAMPMPASSKPAPQPVNTGVQNGRISTKGSQLSSDGFRVNPTQQRILDALAWYESIGNHSPSLTQIGAVALIDPTGGHFSNTVGPLSSNSLIERGQGSLRLTNKGRKYATLIDAPASLDDYHQILRQRVRKMKSASGRTIDMLDTIIAAGGNSLTTEEIGQAIGIDHTGGYFSNTIGPLSTAGLIVRRSGSIEPTDVLFPNGLA